MFLIFQCLLFYSFDENWKTEVFPEILPKFNLSLSRDPKIVLPALNFKLNSMKFGTMALTNYNPSYGSKYRNAWKQLQIGEGDNNDTSYTIFCGGSVSAVDWATVNGDLNFLAVACNSKTEGIKMNLAESSKSCLQIYEFKSLINEKFQGFADICKLAYVIIVNEGPIWSMKFHPSVSSIEKRIGLLAVTTSNQSISVYSLPYLNHHKSIVLPLQPRVVCKLWEDSLLFGDAFLLQATKVVWYQKNDSDTILAAGFVSGLVGMWNFSREEFSDSVENKVLYPCHVVQAHLEPITALDFKATTGPQFHMLTGSLDRKCKVYTIDEVRYQEIACHYSGSRIQCAEWLMHWPGFLIGYDDCFTTTSLVYRQPLEFGERNMPLLSLDTSIVHLNINHWLNLVMFVTDAGDVIGFKPNQMLVMHPKDKWTFFNFKLFCSNDVIKISDSGTEENGIVFGDLKVISYKDVHSI